MPLNTPKLASLINFEAVALYFGKDENINDIDGTEEKVENEELSLDDIELEQTGNYVDLDQNWFGIESGSEEALDDENDENYETEFHEDTKHDEN
jgi:hypothetical protein